MQSGPGLIVPKFLPTLPIPLNYPRRMSKVLLVLSWSRAPIFFSSVRPLMILTATFQNNKARPRHPHSFILSTHTLTSALYLRPCPTSGLFATQIHP